MARDRNNPLGDAHRGYVFQDVATAYVLLWGLHHEADSITVDRKAHDGDLFDDLTIRINGRVLRRQYKSAADPSLTFSEEHFRTKSSDLRIDDVLASFRQAGLAPADEYRVCATWRSPTRGAVPDFLEPSSAPGTFGSHPTHRWRLKVAELWPSGGQFAWKLRQPAPIARDELVALADRLVIELDCPGASLDPARPGSLEQLNIDFFRDRIGVGRYPNEGRSVRDVMERLVRRASQARASQETVIPSQLLQALDLRTDYGRVAQRSPVVAAAQVGRVSVLAALDSNAGRHPRVLVVGSPGSGKTWLLSEFADALRVGGVLVARHYCYLRPGDGERELRITADALFAKPSIRGTALPVVH